MSNQINELFKDEIKGRIIKVSEDKITVLAHPKKEYIINKNEIDNIKQLNEELISEERSVLVSKLKNDRYFIELHLTEEEFYNVRDHVFNKYRGF